MARQTIAQDWKTIETLFDQRTQTFSEIRRNVGRFTLATALDKTGTAAVQRGYRWNPKSFHGTGGYWVNGNGDTIELLPGRV